jgi:hypothetical protein
MAKPYYTEIKAVFHSIVVGISINQTQEYADFEYVCTHCA